MAATWRSILVVTNVKTSCKQNLDFGCLEEKKRGSVRMSYVVVCVCGNEDEHRCTIKEFSSLCVERFSGIFLNLRQIFFVRDDGFVFHESSMILP